MPNDNATSAAAKVAKSFYVFVGLATMAWLGAAVLYFS
jgi:hypothetical protein